MEISALFSPIWRQKWHIIILSIITGLLLLIYSQFFSAPNYYSYVFFTVSYRDEQKPVTEYDYANYYGNYASLEFARTVSAWPKDPYFIKQIYDDAGVDQVTDQGLVDKLLGNFSVKREERANLKVNIRSKTEENLRKLTASFIKILRERMDSYNRQSATQYQLVNLTSTPYITILQPEEALPLGIALGILLGVLLAYIRESWQGRLATAHQLENVFEQSVFWSRKGTKNDVRPVVALLNSRSKKEAIIVNNRSNITGFLKHLSTYLTEPVTIVTANATELKKQLAKYKHIVVTHEVPAKKPTKVLYLLDFPEDSIALVEHETTPMLIVAQRGKSRLAELHALKVLTANSPKAIVLL
ncbi:MAG: hypothetical protein HY817_05440 [Candidatus Abawacabacteria bacterium]|nr:hypothetical protein [Candidatus Abawacabacteria bacterium]